MYLILISTLDTVILPYFTFVSATTYQVIDMFVGTIFLLAVCFIESIILNFDLGWKRLQYALKAATFGSKRHPEGRNIFPKWLCKYDFIVTVPHATGFLCIYQIVNVASNPYGGYPTSLVAWGWTLLALCCATVLLTVWKRDESKLPAIEDDPIFQEVLGNDIQMASDDNDGGDDGVEECAIPSGGDKPEAVTINDHKSMSAPLFSDGEEAALKPDVEEAPDVEVTPE